MMACLMQQSFSLERVDFKGTSDQLLPSFHDYICILQKGKNSRDLLYAKHLHTHMHAVGLEAHQTLGSHLVALLVHCGFIGNAQQIFDKLTTRCEFSWTPLIQGYTGCGQHAHALALFKDMQAEHVCPTSYTFKALLKASASLECVRKSLELHHAIATHGFDEDFFISSSIVDLYVKCGMLEEAQIVFDELEDRDAIVWNFMLAGYLKQGFDCKVLDYFVEMQSEGVLPDSVTYVCALKACCNLGTIERGRMLHANIMVEGCENSLEVGNTLVDMYARCGFFEEALDVIEEMPMQDVITWSALIAGYAEHSLAEEAFHGLHQMQSKGVHPNSVTFSSCVKACSSADAIRRGLEIHAEIIAEGYEGDLFVSSNLLDLYSKCGMFDEAWEIFDRCETPDTVSWNALASGYLKHGLFEEVLNCFDRLYFKGIHPDAITFICCLKACGSILTLRRGQELHAEILKKGSEGDAYVGNSLVDMYVRCRSLTDAHQVFTKLPAHDVVSWNTLMSGYVEHGLYEDTLECFRIMQAENISPTTVTFLNVIRACGCIGAIDTGHGVHAEAAKHGSETDPFLTNTLVTFYAESGHLAEALQLFDNLTDEDAGRWNFFIKKYVDSKMGEDASQILEEMQLEGASVGLITALCTLKACIGLKDIDRGLELHMKIVKEGFEGECLVANLVLDLYVTCGFLEEAQVVFDQFAAILSAVEWTCFIAGYVEIGEIEKAFSLFSRMQEHGLMPIHKTFLSLLKLCGNSLAVEAGKKLHAQISKLSQCEPACGIIATTLIDMYGKFGSRIDAEKVFRTMTYKDLVGWSALIGVYVCQGECELVLTSFNLLRAESVLPDEILFVNVLTACNHAGLAVDGQDCFEIMTKEYRLTPITEHYNCIIDLLGRAGRLGEALALVQSMPMEPDHVTLSCVLGAFRDWSHINLCRKMLDQALELKVDNESIGTLL